MSTVLNADEYGAFSPKWMISRAAQFVPRERLEAVFTHLLYYIDDTALGKETRSASDMMDLAAQGLLTGAYVPTAWEMRSFESPEETPPEEEALFSQEEIAEYFKDLEDAPETEDPMEGFKL